MVNINVLSSERPEWTGQVLITLETLLHSVFLDFEPSRSLIILSSFKVSNSNVVSLSSQFCFLNMLASSQVEPRQVDSGALKDECRSHVVKKGFLHAMCLIWPTRFSSGYICLEKLQNSVQLQSMASGPETCLLVSTLCVHADVKLVPLWTWSGRFWAWFFPWLFLEILIYFLPSEGTSWVLLKLRGSNKQILILLAKRHY